MGLKVILPLTNEQRTKLLARQGRLVDQLVLDVSEDVFKELDPERVLVSDTGKLIIHDKIEEKGTDVRLSKSGWGWSTDILKQLADYIIDNDKQVFDVDVLKKLYAIQDSVVNERKQKIMKEQEEIARREEAKQILKDLIQKYEDKIASLEQDIKSLNDEIRKLEKENDKLNEKLKDFVEFITKQGLMNDFIEFVREKRAEEETTKIKEEYGFEEDC
jgi:uncharacterized coiled-coil protein SlyX